MRIRTEIESSSFFQYIFIGIFLNEDEKTRIESHQTASCRKIDEGDYQTDSRLKLMEMADY